MAVLEADAPPAGTGAPPVWRRRSSERWTPYALIAPTAALIAVFLIYPIGNVVYYSLFKYNVIKPWANGFVGLDNYRQMLADPLFWNSLAFTTKWVLVEVVLQLVFGVVLALLINESFIGRTLARSLVFSPWAVSGVLTTTIWLLIYNPTTGFARYLADFGIGEYGTSPLIAGNSAFWEPSWPSSGVACRSSRSSSSRISSRSPVISTRPRRWTAPGRSASSGRSRCRTFATRSSSPRSCGRSGSSTTSTCSTHSPAAGLVTPR